MFCLLPGFQHSPLETLMNDSQPQGKRALLHQSQVGKYKLAWLQQQISKIL